MSEYSTHLPTTVVWGTWDDDENGAPEEAIVVTRYIGVLGIEQDGAAIGVAYRDVPALLKVMRRMAELGTPDRK